MQSLNVFHTQTFLEAASEMILCYLPLCFGFVSENKLNFTLNVNSPSRGRREENSFPTE